MTITEPFAVSKVALPSGAAFAAAVADVGSRYTLAELADAQVQAGATAELTARVPGLAEVFQQVRDRIRADRAVILTGVPVDRDPVLVALMGAVGRVSVQQDDENPDAARMVWDVRPGQMMEGMGGHVAHGSKSTAKSPLHTDAVQVQPRDRYLALACVENSRERGSATAVLPLDRVLPEISADDRRLLGEPMFTFSKLVHGAESSTTTSILDTVVDADGVTFDAIRYSEKSLEFGRDAGHEAPEAHQAALERLHRLTRREDRATEVWLEPDEMLVFDNARVLHGRGRIRGTDRHLKRLRASALAS